jgi:hypothetical protein
LQLIESTIFFFLVTYVFSDNLLISTHCRDKIPSCPEMLSYKIPLPTKIIPRYRNGTFAFDISNHKQLAAVLALDQEGNLATRVAYGLGPTFYRTMPLHPYLLHDFRGYGTDKLWFNAWSTTSNDGAYPLLATTIEARPEIKERELLRSRNEYTRQYAADGLRFSNTHVAGDRTLDVTMDMIKQGSAEAGMSLEQITEKRHASDHCRLGTGCRGQERGCYQQYRSINACTTGIGHPARYR